MVQHIYETYFDGDEAPLYEQLESWFQDPKGYFQVALHWLREQGKSLRGIRVLEIGCGTGRFLSELAKDGAQVEGVDANPKAARYAKKWFGLEIRVGHIEEIESRLGSSRFDVLALFEIIEHLRQPVDVLRHLSRFLVDGGLLLLSAPNFGLFRSEGAGYGDLSTHFEHIHFFHRRSLTALVQHAGFDLEVFLPCGSPAPLTERMFNRMGVRSTLTSWWPRLRQIAPLRTPLRLAYRMANKLTGHLGIDKDAYTGLFLVATKRSTKLRDCPTGSGRSSW